ncbi:WD40 repeat domain-containing protein [Aspergillus puulaauensis]|uniref:Mitochondrial division protein 1 n=1 Tax=Aspergillus puulaauensis TaxID=1220207 RepID=A0A7R7XE47_9EURO|nr:uncharacterized protein APUU_12349A [Aspergillus puulaauensis]BCS19521.1 hypothetical protein APUU_12349A [Aspergillus puulaauensis]
MHILKEDLGISAKPLKVQFDKLVLQPLLGLEESNFPIQTLVVAVDALDKCESDDDIRVILHLIPQLKQIRPVHLRIFVTSRPELAIRLGFQEEVEDDHQDFILHQVPSHIIKEDISLFLEHRLGRIRKKRYLPPGWPGGTNTQMLITMSVPLFIFAVTICRILLDYQWDPDDSLAEILIHHTDISQLNGTYLPVLDRLLVARDGSKKVQLIEEYRTVLGTIILLESPLSLNALATLLGVQKHFLHIRLNSLHSILDVPHNETTPIRLFHISLRDCLLNADTRERTPLWIDQKEINQKLTSRCLHIMQQKLKKNMCNLQSYGVERTTINSQCMSDHLPPELQYSCRYWIHHLAGSRYPRSQIDVIAAFLDAHLLHWVEVMSILGIVSEVLGNIRTLQSVTQNSEISKFLHDAERFVLKNSQIADITPLQIYASGLLFAPARSIVRRKFGKDSPGWADGYPRVEETWSPELQTLEGHSKSVLSIAFSPDGQDLASASNDTTIKVWDSATGHLKQTLNSHSVSVLSVAFSPDGKRLVSTSDGTIKIWDSATGYLKQSFKCYPGPVQSAAFSPDGHRLASTSYDRTIKIWDSITGNLQQTISAHYGLVESVVFSPNGQQLASASDDRTIKIWDSATGTLQQTLNGHLNWVWSATFSLDGQRLASASSDRTIKIWDPVTGNLEQTLGGHSGPVWSVAFSPDGQLLASTSYDGTIKIWYPNTGVLKQTLKGHSNSVVSITFRPDGQQLASASHDRTIKIWDPDTDDMKYTHEGHSGPVRLFAFSPDGQRLASVSSNDPTIKIWDSDTGGLMYTIHTERVATSVRFSINSPHLITNVGNFNIAQFYEISFLSSQETSPEISIIQAGQWVTIRGMKELWLPQEYRRRSAIKNGAVALGLRSGRVSVIKFRD